MRRRLKFSSDFVKLNEITKEKEQTEQLLEEKMERWEYLEDPGGKDRRTAIKNTKR